MSRIHLQIWLLDVFLYTKNSLQNFQPEENAERGFCAQQNNSTELFEKFQREFLSKNSVLLVFHLEMRMFPGHPETSAKWFAEIVTVNSLLNGTTATYTRGSHLSKLYQLQKAAESISNNSKIRKGDRRNILVHRLDQIDKLLASGLIPAMIFSYFLSN